MKFSQSIKLRNIILALICVVASFHANSFTVSICVRLDPNSSTFDIDNYNKLAGPSNQRSWAFYINGWGGDVSSRFALPYVVTSNIDYCTSSITLDDQIKRLLPTDQLTIREYGSGTLLDPIVIHGYALTAFKNCKIEIYGGLVGSSTGGIFYYYLAVTGPIQCNFPENSAGSESKLKKPR